MGASIQRSKRLIPGALQHTGATAGFFNTTPASQPADTGALTDSSGGVVDGTVAAVPADTLANVAAACNGNFADVSDRINDIRTALRTLGLMA